MNLCSACGRRPDQECCALCHRAARLSTYGNFDPKYGVPPAQALVGRYVIRRSVGTVLKDVPFDKATGR